MVIDARTLRTNLGFQADVVSVVPAPHAGNPLPQHRLPAKTPLAGNDKPGEGDCKLLQHPCVAQTGLDPVGFRIGTGSTHDGGIEAISL